MKRKRREAAWARNNAEIVGSAAFGLRTDILDLKKRGPKIRVRKRMVLPREWAKHNDPEDALRRQSLEDPYLFAVSLFDKSDLSGGRGFRTVTSSGVFNETTVCRVVSTEGVGYRSSPILNDRYNAIRGPSHNDRVTGRLVDHSWLQVQVAGRHGIKYLPIINKEGAKLMEVVLRQLRALLELPT